MMSLLKKSVLSFFVLLLTLGFNGLYAQSDARTHFIYIQSENQQPFYVILNKKSYSSSSVGYLIISKLIDGNYNVTIGFPKDEYPASTYALSINGNDAGFSLKKSSGNIWNLIDKLSQQPLAIVNSDGTAADVVASGNTTQTAGGFGSMLSKTSTDTTNYTQYAKSQETPKKEVSSNIESTSNTSKESADVIKTVPDNTVAKNSKIVKERTDTVTKGNEIASSVQKEEDATESLETAAARSATQSIIKIDERSDRRGVSMSFVVTSGEKIDTINTFFPGDSKDVSNVEAGSQVAADNTSNTDISAEKKALKTELDNREKPSENPFYKGNSNEKAVSKTSDLSLFSDTDSSKDISEKKSEASKSTVISDVQTSPKENTKDIFNSTCSNLLTDKDVEKIRKRMIAKSSDEEMIAVARKYIDTKCVYTAHVKELGGLLISDHGRLALYRILYPNVYDGGQFPSLEDQLLDKNYKLQFESLLRNR